ncbi:MAG: hypothetical protein ACK4NM_19190, partial [Hydrogenophaga sp.]
MTVDVDFRAQHAGTRMCSSCRVQAALPQLQHSPAPAPGLCSLLPAGRWRRPAATPAHDSAALCAACSAGVGRLVVPAEATAGWRTWADLERARAARSEFNERIREQTEVMRDVVQRAFAAV